MKTEIKVFKIDGIKNVGLYVDGWLVEAVETNSQFTIKEAKEYLRNKFIKI